MKNIILVFFIFILQHNYFAQGRNINKLTLETTYSNMEIHQSLRDLVDKPKKEDFFNDDFFNDFLKKMLLDKRFTAKEKVQLFYLMQKKVGYAFVGVSYLPPQQNYFVFHSGKVQVFQKSKDYLKGSGISQKIFIQIADSHQTNDPIIASNALLLATLLDNDSIKKKLQKYSDGAAIMRSKNPAIFNHYLSLSASLVQDSVIASNLKKNLKIFTQNAMIEDILCALYSRSNPLSIIKDYIQNEKNIANKLAIQTACCALYSRIPLNSYKQSLNSLASSTTKEPWKNELINRLLTDKIPYNYELTNSKILVPKVWDYVQITIYNDGALISNNTLLEFDPN